MRWAMVFLAGLAGCAAALSDPVSVSQSYWDWQLSDPIRMDVEVQVFDTDPDSVTAADIALLNARGVKIICYVSIGTVEDYRNDVDDFPAAVVGNTYDDWPDEKFLDIRQLDVLLPIMTARFQRCKDMGFDAIEPDNMDVFDNDSGFPLTVADGVTYILALADIAHGMGLEIGQKNIGAQTAQLVGVLDFVITEGCFADGWCGDVAPYGDVGKDILAAEYTDSNINWQKACEYAQENNISMILKDRDLTAALRTCP